MTTGATDIARASRSTSSPATAVPPSGPAQSVGTPDFVDGGSALLHRPYRTDEWAPVRKAWWWHTVGMIWLLPFYSVVALTLWQRPSRQSLGRRALWSTAMTLAALSVIGLPAFVAFSRRWYWLYRVDGDPELRGVGARQDGPASGYLAWFASTGASLADAIAGETQAPPPPPPPLPDQWQALVTEAAAGEARIRAAALRASGPSAAAITRAAQEADQATAAVASVAHHAAEVDAARQRIDVVTIERRLAALGTDSDDTDVGATRRSLEAQLATRRRMDDRMIRLQRQLERTAAQICEAAAQAEELSIYTPDVDAGPAPLVDAVDGLTAMREALEEVDRAT